MSKAAEVLDLARAKAWKITTAESCTGGMLAAALTDIAGSSDVFDCGYVTYSNAAKMRLLGVRGQTLERFGAVSEETASEMAEGALADSGADIAVSITGIAGPGGSGKKPEGRVCFGLAVKNQPTICETRDFGAPGRASVRTAATGHALDLLAAALQSG